MSATKEVPTDQREGELQQDPPFPHPTQTNDNSNPQQGSVINNNKSASATGKVSPSEKGSEQSANDVPTTAGDSGATNKTASTEREGRKLFVGGLPPDVTSEEFETFFSQFGTLLDSVVMFDRETRRSRGFGFVTYSDPEVAKKLLNTMGGDPPMPGRLLMRDKLCEVKPAEPKEKSRSHTGRTFPFDQQKRSGGGRGSFDGASSGMAVKPHQYNQPHYQNPHHPGYNMYGPPAVPPSPGIMMYPPQQHLPPYQHQQQYGAPPPMMMNNYSPWPSTVSDGSAAYPPNVYYPTPQPIVAVGSNGDPAMTVAQAQPPIYNVPDASAACTAPVYAVPLPAVGGNIQSTAAITPMMMGGTSSAMHPMAPGLPLNGADNNSPTLENNNNSPSGASN